jgi:tetratricopeptide (TPR) repeat protein
MINHAKAGVGFIWLALALAPAATMAQGIAGSGELSQGFSGMGFATLSAHAREAGVGNPLGFKESTPPVTSGLTSKIDPAIEYAKGFTDLNLGRFAEAEADFYRALRVDPNNPKTLFMLGEAKVARGDLKGAEWAFEKALKNDPQQIVVRGEYAVVLARLGQADQAQAQFAILNARAVACGGACLQADDFKAEVARVQAALSNTQTPAHAAG